VAFLFVLSKSKAAMGEKPVAVFLFALLAPPGLPQIQKANLGEGK
jgi:hypothetical protein